MTDEEESGSVFGGLSEAAGAAWDAAANVETAGGEAFLATGLAMDIGAERVAAGAAYAVGSYDTADAIDASTQDQAAVFRDTVDDVGDKLSEAWTDVVGE